MVCVHGANLQVSSDMYCTNYINTAHKRLQCKTRFGKGTITRQKWAKLSPATSVPILPSGMISTSDENHSV